MAKKKTTTRKSTRHSTYPHRSSSTTASNSKAASVSLSNASSPSPPPDNHHHHHSSSSSASYPSSPAPTASSACVNNNNNAGSSSRRKGLPRRSPSQNDPSKGIVFSFRFQNDPSLSMAVDIRSYDQQFGPPDPDSTSTIAAQKKADSQARPSSLSLAGSHARSNSADDTIISNKAGVVRMNGDHWSSDPTAYRNSNVFDQTRNLLILHTRKPAATASAVESGASSPST
ncbi:hypothetical protein BGZ95_011874, partial [Linnemannia exigua]